MHFVLVLEVRDKYVFREPISKEVCGGKKIGLMNPEPRHDEIWFFCAA